MGLNLEEESISLMDEVKSVITEAERSSRLTGFFIGNTRKPLPTPVVVGPKRSSHELVAGSAVVATYEAAREVASKLDGVVDFIFADAEKKIPRTRWGQDDAGNIELAVRSASSKSQILTYKANDLAAQAIDIFVDRLFANSEKGIGGSEIAVIGLGSVGSKVALSLAERGANVRAYRRDSQKLHAIVNGLNLVRPEETLSEIISSSSALAAAAGAAGIIAATPGIPVVTAEMVTALNAPAFIIDAGKGCIDPTAVAIANQRKISLYRTDIQPAIPGLITALLENYRASKRGPGRREVAGVTLVARGLLGELGDHIVDNTDEPSVYFGTANGQGEFMSALSQREKQNMLDQLLQQISGVTD